MGDGKLVAGGGVTGSRSGMSGPGVAGVGEGVGVGGVNGSGGAGAGGSGMGSGGKGSVMLPRYPRGRAPIASGPP